MVPPAGAGRRIVLGVPNLLLDQPHDALLLRLRQRLHLVQHGLQHFVHGLYGFLKFLRRAFLAPALVEIGMVSATELRALARVERDPRKRVRLLAIANVRDGMAVDGAARAGGMGRATLY